MTDAATRAELVKLARILDTDVDNVEYLAYLEASRLRALREGITEALFENERTFVGYAVFFTLEHKAVDAKAVRRSRETRSGNSIFLKSVLDLRCGSVGSLRDSLRETR